MAAGDRSTAAVTASGATASATAKGPIAVRRSAWQCAGNPTSVPRSRASARM